MNDLWFYIEEWGWESLKESGKLEFLGDVDVYVSLSDCYVKDSEENNYGCVIKIMIFRLDDDKVKNFIDEFSKLGVNMCEKEEDLGYNLYENMDKLVGVDELGNGVYEDVYKLVVDNGKNYDWRFDI